MTTITSRIAFINTIDRLQLRASRMSHRDLDIFTNLRYVARRVVDPYTEPMPISVRVRALRRWLHRELDRAALGEAMDRDFGYDPGFDFYAGVRAAVPQVVKQLGLGAAFISEVLCAAKELEDRFNRDPFPDATQADCDWMFIDDAMFRNEDDR